MSIDRERIEAAIAALSAQRELLGDEVVDLALAPLFEKLAAIAPPEQSLRQVTILFLDVVGSTSISQHLDPEDIHALMNGALSSSTAIVTAHGGQVLQYAGDSLLAVFGLHLAREDDAERGVRAGLALLAEGRRLGAAVKAAHGHAGFDVRIGVHTGPVLLGGGVEGDGGIRGVAVNITARLEQTAPPGALRISRDTQRLVRHLFEVEAQQPLQVKGIDTPIASYLVLRTRADAADPREVRDGRDAPLIGRDTELEQLLGLVAEARIQARPCLAIVSADAGLGKSRLLEELAVRCGAEHTLQRVLQARARSHDLRVPFGLVRTMFARHAGILDSDPAEVARAKLVATFGAAFGAERAGEHAALVGQLIGLDFSGDPHIAGIIQDGRQIRARAFHAIAQFLRVQASEAGLVTLLLDDLHWADDGSLDLIEHLAQTSKGVPLVLACFTRPALFERRPAWSHGVSGACRVALAPLPASSSERLADALLSRLAEPEPVLRALLIRSAEGNPFHMQELLAMMIDDGVVSVTPDGWRVDRSRLGHLRVPTTLTAVLQARLDALPTPDKATLQRCSVIGPVFWDQALERLEAGSVTALDALAHRALIGRRESSAFDTALEYAFGHHLLHQVTYDTVLKAVRRDMHLLVADWLVVVTGSRIGEHVGLIAEHYERGGDPARATEYLHRAASASYDSAAYDGALVHLDRALALVLANNHRSRFELLVLRANVYNAVGRRQEQEDDIAAANACAETLGDDALRARVRQLGVLVAVITGRYEQAIVEAERTADLAAVANAPEVMAMLMLHKAQALMYLGRRSAAADCVHKALELTEGASDAESGYCRIVALNRLYSISRDDGQLDVARGHLARAIDEARATRNRRFEGGLMSNLGRLEMQLGQFDSCAALVQGGLAISREIGDHGAEPYALHNLGQLALLQADPRRGAALAIEARAIAVDVGDKACEAECALLEAQCRAALGEATAAMDCFDAYDTWPGAAAMPAGARLSGPGRALLALAQGQRDVALARTRDMLTWLDERGEQDRAADAEHLFACHQVLVAEGAARAEEMLVRAHAVMIAAADSLPPADRAIYLEHVPLNRAIEEAWRALD